MGKTDQKKTFNAWLSEHKALIFKVVLAYAYEAFDREDLFQEILIQLWKSVPRFRGDSAATTWIYRVALNTAISWSRKEKKHQLADGSYDTVEHFLLDAPQFKDDRVGWLYEKISELHEIDRSVTLLMLDGYSYREIGDILGITVSHVGVKINRIKKHLVEERKGEQ